jgi:predicted helicase
VEPKEGYLVIVAYGGRHVVHGSIYKPFMEQHALSLCDYFNRKIRYPKLFPKVRAVVVKIELSGEAKP